MTSTNLKDKLITALNELGISCDKFLNGELSYSETMALQSKIGRWIKIIDKTGNKTNVQLKVWKFSDYQVLLGTETLLNSHLDPNTIKEFFEEDVEKFSK